MSGACSAHERGQLLRQEVRFTHLRFDRAEGMLDRPARHPHQVRVLIKSRRACTSSIRCACARRVIRRSFAGVHCRLLVQVRQAAVHQWRRSSRPFSTVLKW